MANTRTTLTTDDRISHALTMSTMYAKGTACGRVFVAWESVKKKLGLWHGVEEPLPKLGEGMVDCITCIVKTGSP